MNMLWFRLFLLCVALLSISQSGIAQQPDVRVSPDEPISYDLPAEIRIQSAASIGSRTLAVWGTTVNDPGSGVVNALVMQMLDDTTMLGQQRKFTSREARPFGFVQVLEFQASFLVIWNDRRSNAPGIYTLQVSMDGSPTGSEQRISTGVVQPDSTGRIVVLGEIPTGRLLLWNDVRKDAGGVYAMRIAADGTIETEVRLGLSLKKILNYSNLPGSRLLMLSDTALYFVDTFARLRSIPRPQLLEKFYLGSDTSVTCLSGNRVFYFSSLFDNAPQWTATVSALDSALKGTSLITRDSTGLIHVHFNTILLSGDSYTQGFRIIHAYDIEVVTADSITEPKLIAHHVQLNAGCGQIGHYQGSCSVTQFVGVSWEAQCDNGNYANINWQTTNYLRGSPTSPDPSNRRSTSVVDNLGHYQLFTSGSIPPPCPLQIQLLVSRIQKATQSSLRVRIGSNQVSLHADIEPWIDSIAHGNPGIFLRNGELYATWVQSDSAPFKVGQWGPGLPKPAAITASHNFKPLTGPSYNGDQVRSHWEAGRSQHIRFPQNSIVAGFQYIRDEVLRYYTETTWYTRTANSASFEIYRADTAGWQQLLSIVDIASTSYYPEPPSFGPYHEGWVDGYDPNRDEILAKVVYYKQGASNWITLYWCGKNGEIITLPNVASLRSSDITKDPTLYLPVDSLEYLRIIDSNATWKREQTTVAEYSFTTGGPGVRYQRMLGPYFLRYFWNDTTGSDLRIERYHVNGALLFANIVHLLSRTDDMTLVQRPTDSTITLVYADSSGVHLTLFNKLLWDISGNVDLSATRKYVAHPAAVWRNDTLFAVWEDYRNSNADVYGNWIKRSDIASSVSQPESMNREMFINPNPAHDRIQITLPDQTGSTLEIIDMMGQVVQQIPVDAGRSVLDVSIAGLPGGIYMVRYQPHDGPVAYYRMVVTH
jgi:hypothetical protein